MKTLPFQLARVAKPPDSRVIAPRAIQRVSAMASSIFRVWNQDEMDSITAWVLLHGSYPEPITEKRG